MNLDDVEDEDNSGEALIEEIDDVDEELIEARKKKQNVFSINLCDNKD